MHKRKLCLGPAREPGAYEKKTGDNKSKREKRALRNKKHQQPAGISNEER